MKSIGLALGIILFSLFPAFLHAQDRFEAFGGYSYLRASQVTEACAAPGLGPPPVGCSAQSSHPNLNGWEASLEYKPFKVVGIVADFGGHYGTIPPSAGGGSMHVHTFLFGPQFSVPRRFSPFVHVLAGAARESTFVGTGGAFAIALGGGIDVNASPRVGVRLFQLDYLGSDFSIRFRNQVRVSAGLVFRL
jgi:hypothetical protein